MGVEEVVVDGKRIAITHPDLMIWESQGISKLDYIHYLVRVSGYMIQHARDRLLMLWLYPHGIAGKRIEKRSVPASAPEWVSRVYYKNKERILLNDTATLVWAANYGALEFHVPFDRYDKTDFPMEMVTAFIAEYFREQMPEQITLERVVSKRGSKLYFDYLQLWRGRTMPVVYSPRARPHATVATPLTWPELAEGIQPSDYTMLNIAGRISEKGDLFQQLTANKQNQSLHEILAFIERNKG
ncbi:non-homologous end-joining DNA ligase LigD [Paenibacillus glycanilyticus]|uniref:non-homologous end-joining DNA ligase LigD n=1 Tax=Paenibacillus glycanilyticus TaxID=126569 RepID=UPI001FD3C0C3|nr:DNA polymerase domain-containing protein [Paenibacillus glycanilyticus]